MPALSHYRLNDYSEIIDLQHRIGNDKFVKYLNMVYSLARGISIGQIYPIEQHVKTANRNIFIKCVCLYMIETGSMCNVEFANDYSSIRGIQSLDSYRQDLSDRSNKHKLQKKWRRNLIK